MSSPCFSASLWQKSFYIKFYLHNYLLSIIRLWPALYKKKIHILILEMYWICFWLCMYKYHKTAALSSTHIYYYYIVIKFLKRRTKKAVLEALSSSVYQGTVVLWLVQAKTRSRLLQRNWFKKLKICIWIILLLYFKSFRRFSNK